MRKNIWLVLLFSFFSVMAYSQESELTITKEQYDRLMQIFKTLESKYQLQTALLANLQQTKDSLQQSLDDGKKEIESLTLLRNQLQTEINEKQNSIIELQRQLAESKVDSATFKEKLANWEKTLITLESQWMEVSTLYEKASKSYQEFKIASENQIKDLKFQRNVSVVVAISVIVLYFIGGLL